MKGRIDDFVSFGVENVYKNLFPYDKILSRNMSPNFKHS